MTANKARAYTGPGGLASNAADLVAWTRALVDRKAVSAASFRQMTTTAPVRAGFTPPYGFGLSLLPLAGQPAILPIGVLAGFTSVLAYFPEQDLIIVVLANSRHAWVQTLVRQMAQAVMGLPAPVEHDLPVAAAVAKRLVGNYDDRMFKFRVYLQSDNSTFTSPSWAIHGGSALKGRANTSRTNRA